MTILSDLSFILYQKGGALSISFIKKTPDDTGVFHFKRHFKPLFDRRHRHTHLTTVQFRRMLHLCNIGQVGLSPF